MCYRICSQHESKETWYFEAYCKALPYIGPLNPAIHGIIVASVIAFSILCMCVLLGFVTFFPILLQYNIRPPDPKCHGSAFELAAWVNIRRHDTSPDPNCDGCASKFVAGVNLRRHDTLLDPNCNVCAPEFGAGVNLRRHDTSTRTAMNVMMIFCWELG